MSKRIELAEIELKAAIELLTQDGLDLIPAIFNHDDCPQGISVKLRGGSGKDD